MQKVRWHPIGLHAILAFAIEVLATRKCYQDARALPPRLITMTSVNCCCQAGTCPDEPSCVWYKHMQDSPTLFDRVKKMEGSSAHDLLERPAFAPSAASTRNRTATTTAFPLPNSCGQVVFAGRLAEAKVVQVADGLDDDERYGSIVACGGRNSSAKFLFTRRGLKTPDYAEDPKWQTLIRWQQLDEPQTEGGGSFTKRKLSFERWHDSK